MHQSPWALDFTQSLGRPLTVDTAFLCEHQWEFSLSFGLMLRTADPHQLIAFNDAFTAF